MPRSYRAGDLPASGTDRRSFRRAYLRQNAFELWIALAAVVGSLVFFASPPALRAAAVGQGAGDLAYVWNALYGIGGAAIVYGLVRPSARFEIAGLALLIPAVLVNAVAVTDFHGLTAVASGVTYLGLAVASAVRIYYVVRVGRPIVEEA